MPNNRYKHESYLFIYYFIFMFCMKRSFLTSKSNLQIIFVLNEIFYPNVQKNKNCDFSKILQFSETVIVLIFIFFLHVYNTNRYIRKNKQKMKTYSLLK